MKPRHHRSPAGRVAPGCPPADRRASPPALVAYDVRKSMIGNRVLVADDEPHIRNILRRLLLGDGFCVCEAGDGRETLAAAAHCDVDVIVMDILMPELSGAE